MTTKAKKTKTETPEPVRAVALFDASEIEFSVKSAILKNTLPAVRDNWTNWLASYDASTLETDEDFKRASEFVNACEDTEKKLKELEETALKGDASKIIAEIRSMRETTRTKRLEFSNAVDYKKNKVKSDAIAAAVKKCRDDVSVFKYRSVTIDYESEMRLAIKGKSAILKMQEALDSKCAELLAAAKDYCNTFEAIRGQVAEVYQAAGETATDSELEMLVRSYADTAPERAKFILDQKRVKREQDELDRKRREQEAREAQPAPQAAPVPAPAPAAQASVLSAAVIPGTPVRTLRFGATFDTTDIENTISLINSVGGRDVKFVEMKK